MILSSLLPLAWALTVSMLAVLPDRAVASGFEDAEPLDCVAAAITSQAFAATFVAPPGDYFCLPKGSALGADFCFDNVDTCQPGCRVNVSNNTIAVDWLGEVVQVRDSLSVAVRVSPPIFSACTVNITVTSAAVDLRYPTLRAGLDGVFAGPVSVVGQDLTGVNFSGCSAISFIASLVVDILNPVLGLYVQHTLARVPASADVCPVR